MNPLTQEHSCLDKRVDANAQMTLFSPAKINLFFRVLRRREDGYHEIASLYQTISLGDTLQVSISQENFADQITCTDPLLPCDANNFVVKAANLFRKKTGIEIGVNCHLIKHVPIEAGLGGGSGNAASMLWALNELCGRPVTTKDLCHWSAEIGSDMPFFFSKGTAYCSGRGEVLQELAHLKQRFFWIVKPKGGLSTAEVYRNCDAASLPDRDPLTALSAIYNGEAAYFNDLEISAFKLMPSLAELKHNLLQIGFHTAVMTGSGSAFFCFGEIEKTPILDGVDFYKVHFMQREEGSWYELSNFC